MSGRDYGKNGRESDSYRGDEYEDGGEGGGITLDTVFDCLRHPRRRFVLYYLRECEVVTMDELAEQIAAQETDTPPEEVDADQRKPIETNLVHVHLPKLADTLIIEYDRRSNTIRHTELPQVLDEILCLIAQYEDDAGA